MKFEIFNRFHENVDQDSSLKITKLDTKIKDFSILRGFKSDEKCMDLFIIDSNPDKV